MERGQAVPGGAGWAYMCVCVCVVLDEGSMSDPEPLTMRSLFITVQR